MGGKFNIKTRNSQKSKLMSRKELRRQKRKEKKAKRNEYYKNKAKINLVKSSSDKPIKENEKNSNKKSKENQILRPTKESLETNLIKQPNTTLLDEQNKLHKQQIREKMKLERGMIKQRKKTLLEANIEEDKEIKKLEKHLKLNKRKTKSVPKSFVDEGLDYLLEVCDTNKLLEFRNTEINLQDSDSEFQDDLALITGKGKRKLKPKVQSSETKRRPVDKSEGRPNDSSSSEESEDSEDVENSLENQTEDNFSLNEDNQNSSEDSDDELTNTNKMKHKAQSSDSEAKSESEESERDCTIGSEGEETGDLGSEDDVESVNEDDAMDSNSFSDNETTANKDVPSSNKNKKQTNGVWEDIYGRLRDAKGNILKEQEKGKYVPPHLRSLNVGKDEKKTEELARLKKQLKGLVNRLAESNIHSIANQIDELYLCNSRNDMNDSLLSLISEALVAPALTADRLVMEHALLIAVLHANVGMEIGAHFLEAFVLKFNSMYQEGQEVENKELDNILLIISHLYNFKVFHAVLMYNILDLLTDQFLEKEVELILLVLRSVGFSLRKDDPLALKNLVLRLQKKASEATKLKDNTRVKFMLDVLLAVKNNNMSKLPQYDPSLSEHLKKLLKTLVRKGKYVTELKVTLDDLIKVEERGRWWIVGSAWTGAPAAPQAPGPVPAAQGTQYSQAVLELARKQRMNTDTRRNVFCILMSAEDYMDAFEKLLRLGLKAQQEQEIFHVLVHCLQQEKGYNLYYAHLATHFCQADRKHQMTIQYHLWDKFKELSNMSQTQITNLAKFIAHLFLEKALPISVLKVMQFSDMDKPCVRLLRQILLSLLLTNSEEDLVTVFTRVSRPEKLHMFRESLSLFLHHFVLRNTSDLPPDKAKLLKDRVRLAETALTSVDASKFL